MTPLEEIVSPQHERPDPTVEDRPLAIEVRNLVKSFEIPLQRVDSIKERVLHPLAAGQVRRLEALRDVSFEVHRASSSGSSGATAPARARC